MWSLIMSRSFFRELQAGTVWENWAGATTESCKSNIGSSSMNCGLWLWAGATFRERAESGTVYPEQEHWEQEHEMWSLIMSRSYIREREVKQELFIPNRNIRSRSMRCGFWLWAGATSERELKQELIIPSRNIGSRSMRCGLGIMSRSYFIELQAEIIWVVFASTVWAGQVTGTVEQEQESRDMSRTRARICKPFKEPRNRFPAWRSRFWFRKRLQIQETGKGTVAGLNKSRNRTLRQEI